VTDSAGPVALLPPGLPESPARRRLLALGLLGALLALLLFGVIAPIAEGMAERAEHEERQRNLLERLERLSAQGPALRRELEAIDTELAAPEVLLRAQSATQAAAQLQANLRRILEEAGAEVESVQPLPSVAQGKLLRLGLRVELRAGIEPLSRILEAIERHTPRMTVRDALVAAPRGGGGGARGGIREASAAGTDEPRLAVRLDVHGLAQVASCGGDAPGRS
jgi:general secretion pathway protein M